MRKRSFRIAIAISAAALVAGGTAIGATSFAQAESTKAADVVDGFNDVKDDFNDHEREVGVLAEGDENATETDLVAMWQMILTSDGHLTTIEDIDGTFGASTAKATKAWQEANGLKPTGQVDKAAWSAVGDKLETEAIEGAVDVTYPGASDDMSLRRSDDNGSYSFIGVGIDKDWYICETEEDGGEIRMLEGGTLQCGVDGP